MRQQLHFRQRAWGRLCGLLALLLGLIVGCGPGKGDLSGTVSYRGKAVKFGTVTVFGGDGVPKYGVIDRSGKYSISDITGGDIKLTVESPHPREVAATPREPIKRPDAPKGGVARPEQGTGVDPEDVKNWFAIPSKYGFADKSGLTFTLRSGANTHNIELK
jgi:hypothetical protein